MDSNSTQERHRAWRNAERRGQNEALLGPDATLMLETRGWMGRLGGRNVMKGWEEENDKKEPGNEVRRRNRIWARSWDRWADRDKPGPRKKEATGREEREGKARERLGQAGQNQEGGGLVSPYGFQFPQANSECAVSDGILGQPRRTG